MPLASDSIALEGPRGVRSRWQLWRDIEGVVWRCGLLELVAMIYGRFLVETVGGYFGYVMLYIRWRHAESPRVTW